MAIIKEGDCMYGLVLEGGGAKGSYHAGVYKAIEEMGIEISAVAGSSIGALNGAMIIQDDYQKCHDLWYDMSYSMVFDLSPEEIEKLRNLRLTKEDIVLLGSKAKQLILNRGIDIGPIKDLIDTYIDEDKIRSSNKDFGIVTVNLTGLKPVEIFIDDIPRGDLKKYLLASAYLPFFRFEKIDGDLYLDGGFYDNLPYQMLLDKGYKDLIIVRTHAPGVTKKIDLEGTNSIVISPSDDIGRTYLYEAESARRNIRLGYLDGLKAFKGLAGEKYYIETEEDEDFYLNYLLGINEEQVRLIEKIFKLEKRPYRRSLLENIVPKICDYLYIDKNSTYKDLIIQLLERNALRYDIERFKIYSFEELAEKVGEKISLDKKSENREKMELSTLNKIIEKLESLPIFNKDEILIAIGEILFKDIGENHYQKNV